MFKRASVLVLVVMVSFSFGEVFAQQPLEPEETRWDQLSEVLTAGTGRQMRAAIIEIGSLRKSIPLEKSPWNLLDKLLDIIGNKNSDIRIRRVACESVVKLVNNEIVGQKAGGEKLKKYFEDLLRQKSPVYLKVSIIEAFAKLLDIENPTDKRRLGVLKREFANRENEAKVRGISLISLAELKQNVQDEARDALLAHGDLKGYGVIALRIMIENKSMERGNPVLLQPLRVALETETNPDRITDICSIFVFFIDTKATKADSLYESMVKAADTCVEKEYARAFVKVGQILVRMVASTEKSITFIGDIAGAKGKKAPDVIRSVCVDLLGEFLGSHLVRSKANIFRAGKIADALIDILENEPSIEIKKDAAYALGSLKNWMDRRKPADALIKFLLHKDSQLRSIVQQSLEVITDGELSPGDIEKFRIKELQERKVKEYEEWARSKKGLKALRGDS